MAKDFWKILTGLGAAGIGGYRDASGGGGGKRSELNSLLRMMQFFGEGNATNENFQIPTQLPSESSILESVTPPTSSVNPPESSPNNSLREEMIRNAPSIGLLNLFGSAPSNDDPLEEAMATIKPQQRQDFSLGGNQTTGPQNPAYQTASNWAKTNIDDWAELDEKTKIAIIKKRMTEMK